MIIMNAIKTYFNKYETCDSLYLEKFKNWQHHPKITFEELEALILLSFQKGSIDRIQKQFYIIYILAGHKC